VLRYHVALPAPYDRFREYPRTTRVFESKQSVDRVDGTLRNVDAWYDAWNVKSGDALYLAPDQRVRIW